MYKVSVLLIVAISLSAANPVQAEERKLGVTLDFTYMSKWLTRGVEGYGQQGAIFETINLDLWGTGFGTAVSHQEATAGGWVAKERFSYDVYYRNSLFNNEAYQTDYKIRWRYKNYSRLRRTKKNAQEWKADFSWPKILPIKNLTPYYTVYYECAAGRNYDNRDIAGWLHIFGLGYDLNMPKFPKPIHLSADAAYRDGLGGKKYDREWSYATFGISTQFKITDNICFVPELYQQLTMDPSVARRDITYCILTMRYKF